MSYDVLIVDDDPVVRALLTALVGRAGWRATSASGAQAALDHLAGTRCDLVISDVNMPTMTGLELHERIRSDASLARLPVVLLSASADVGAVERQSDGLTLALTKPVRPSSFVAELRAWMGRGVTESGTA